MKFMTYAVALWLFTAMAMPNPPENGVSFSIRKGFGTVSGSLTITRYQIDLTHGKINGSAGVSVIATGNSSRDKHLQNPDWFHAAQHPDIVIRSQSIRPTAPQEYLGVFEVEIRGKKQVLEIPFRVLPEGNGQKLVAAFTLSKAAFVLGGGPVAFLVGDEVTVQLALPF